MNKANVFRSSDFHMSRGDVLHLLIRDEDGDVVQTALYGATSSTSAENEIIYDKDGVVTVDVDGGNFMQSEETPNIHGSLYYNGYLYISPRNPYPTDGIARMAKIRDIDYTDITTIPILYSEGSTQSIYYMEQLQRSGSYIYTAAYANVGGTGTNLLIQLDTLTDRYKIFKLTDEYGSVGANPIHLDGTYLYYIVTDTGVDPDYFSTTTILKYTISDFESASWGMFNTIEYDHTGVPIATVSITEFLADDYYTVHACTSDDTFLYLSFMYNSIPNLAGQLLKVTKTTMVIADTADIPNCSDDIAQTSTHVFLGAETTAGDYGSTWSTVAVRKSDMNVTELLPHSTEIVNQMSYGVAILNIGGTDYLFNLRKDKRINILSLSDVDSWTDAAPSDAYSERILSFIYSDGGAHYIPNEILIDDYNVIHFTAWATIPEIVKFSLTPF